MINATKDAVTAAVATPNWAASKNSIYVTDETRDLAELKHAGGAEIAFPGGSISTLVLER